jgi:hypothetical protein
MRNLLANLARGTDTKPDPKVKALFSNADAATALAVNLQTFWLHWRKLF